MPTHAHFLGVGVSTSKVGQTDLVSGLSSEFISQESKGKEEHLYSAILADTPLTNCSDIDHTVLRGNYTMSAFPS